MSKQIGWPSEAATFARAAGYCAMFVLAVCCLTVAFVRMLPRLGGLLTDDATALRYLTSISGAQVRPAWEISLLFCVLLLIGYRVWRARRGRMQPEGGCRLPLFFAVTLWAGFIPVFALTLVYTRLNSIPVKVAASFIAMFLD